MISKLEVRRQLLHLFFGAFLITMLYFNIFTVHYLIGILLIGMILSKLCIHYNIPIASWVIKNFEREEFRKKFPAKGPIFFMLGSIIVLILFPKDIALASMAILSVGDAASHVFGKLLSKRSYKYLKSVEGTLIGITFSFLTALLFVDVALALVGSVVSLSFESLKLKLEDNLFIPIIAATVMLLIV
jgi:dolichol kinase